MKKSRIQNVKTNIFISVLYQVIVILLGFISRKIFLLILDVEYLGINGILNNILSMLSLSELGISGAIIYSLYKPIAENNIKEITALINYYKKLYIKIAIIIFGCGILFIPFLKYIINTTISMNEVIIYYLLFLINTSVSYLITYKTAILIANQEEYICKRYMIIISIVQFIIQTIVLITLKNFLIYICVQIICSIISNYICSKKAEQIYPYINNKEQLDSKNKKHIWNNIKYMFLYKMGGVILNNTDNILISIIVGTITVGYYSNYSMIITQIAVVCGIIFSTMQASLGNLVVEENKEKKVFVFKVLQVMSQWIFGFCSVCYLVLIQDFIKIWLGENFILEDNIIYICITNFYIQGILYPIMCYRNTTGLFKHTKYIMIFASVINLVLSIVGGKIIGLFGILMATAISRLLTNVWYEPLFLFKNYFKESVIKYYFSELKGIVVLIICILATKYISDFVSISGIYGFIIKLLICAIVPNIIYLMYFYPKEEFKYLKINLIGNRKIFSK